MRKGRAGPPTTADPAPYPTTIALRIASGEPTPTSGSNPDPVPRIITVP